MEFEWDEAKRQLVLAKHGLDFLRAGEVLLGRHIVLEGRHVDEIRQIAVGESQGKMRSPWSLRGGATGCG